MNNYNIYTMRQTPSKKLQKYHFQVIIIDHGPRKSLLYPPGWGFYATIFFLKVHYTCIEICFSLVGKFFMVTTMSYGRGMFFLSSLCIEKKWML